MPSTMCYTSSDELQYSSDAWDKSYLAVPKVAETDCRWDHLG